MKTLKILLIEDDLIVQQVHHYMLKKLGCEIDMASSGLQALELATNCPNYHIAFVDIGLPDISGFEVIQRLCALWRPHKKTAIIALTGYTGEEEKKACLQSGVDHILYKPIDINTMKQFLSQYE